MNRYKKIKRKNQFALLVSTVFFVGISLFAVFLVYATDTEPTYTVSFDRYNNSENSADYTLSISADDNSDSLALEYQEVIETPEEDQSEDDTESKSDDAATVSEENSNALILEFSEESTTESSEETTAESSEETTAESSEESTTESSEETTVESSEETTAESSEETTTEPTAEASTVSVEPTAEASAVSVEPTAEASAVSVEPIAEPAVVASTETTTNTMQVGESFEITVGFTTIDDADIADLDDYNFELTTDGDATITKTGDTTFTVSNVTADQNFTVIVGDVIYFNLTKAAVNIGTATYNSDFSPTTTNAFVVTEDTTTSDIGTGESLDDYAKRTGWTLTEDYSGQNSSGTVISGTHQVGNVYYITGSGNSISISGYLDKVVYLNGVSITSSGVSAISGSQQNGNCPIYVSNRGDTTIVLADGSTNTLKSSGNRAAIEKASGSTNYDATALYANYTGNIPDSSTYMTDYSASNKTDITNTISDAIYDGHLTITCESAYDYGNIELVKTTELGEPVDMVYTGLTESSVSNYYPVVNAGEGTDEDEVVVNETNGTVYIEATDETFAYEEVNGTKYIVYEVYKYDADTIKATSDNCGTLSATGNSFNYGGQGAGIGTRGTNHLGIGNAGDGSRWNIPVELANLHILGGNITATGGTEKGPDGSAGIGTGSSQAGGNVYASGSQSYAIGGGGIQNMNIYGGNITAKATGSAPAAIGGGMSSKWVTVSVYGGTIKAYDDRTTKSGSYEFYRGAGIGGGGGGGENTPSITGATVHIYGGTITATSEQGAGIGAGGGGKDKNNAPYNGQEGHVFISGGDITATSVSGAAIGGSGVNGGGIGGDGYVYITGGTITAEILDGYVGNANTSLAGTAAAIGGAAAGTAGDAGSGYVYISDATVTVTGATGSGIGGGGSTEGKAGDAIVEITGTTTVTATSIESSAIGGGATSSSNSDYNGGKSTVTIGTEDEDDENILINAISENSTGIGAGSADAGTGGDTEIVIYSGDLTANSIGAGSSEKGTGGDAEITMYDGTLNVQDGTAGDNVIIDTDTYIGAGSSEKGDGGDATITVYNGTITVTDNVNDADGNIKSTDEFTGYIGGGNSTDGDGGEATVKVVNGTVSAFSIGGGNASNDGVGGNANVEIGADDSADDSSADETTIQITETAILETTSIGGGYSTDGDGGDAKVTVYYGYLTIYDPDENDESISGTIGGGFSTNATGGEGIVTIERGFVTVDGNIGGGDSTTGTGGDATININGGTTVASLIGSGFSDVLGYADATVTFNGGSINSMVSTQPFAVWYDESGEIIYNEPVYFTRMSLYNTDVLQTSSTLTGISFNDETLNANFGREDIISDGLGVYYIWIPESMSVTGIKAVTDNAESSISYEGTVLSKSVDILRYNCGKNYYDLTFPYSDRIVFYSDEELTQPFAGNYSGILISPYGDSLDFYVEMGADEYDAYYLLEAYQSQIDDDGNGVMVEMELVNQGSDTTNGVYHFRLSVTTSVDLIFKSINPETGESRIAFDLSTANVVVTENSVTVNGYTLDFGIQDPTRSFFLTTSGIPTNNTITFNHGNYEDEEPVYELYGDKITVERIGTIVDINADTVNFSFSDFENSFTSTSPYSAAIDVAEDATLNIVSTDDVNVFEIISTESGIPAIGGNGNILIEDIRLLKLTVEDDTAQIVGKKFTYIDEDGLTGTVPYKFQSTLGELIGYNYNSEVNATENGDKLYEYDYEYNNYKGTFVATSVSVQPSDAYTISIEDNDLYLTTARTTDEDEEDAEVAMVYISKDNEEIMSIADYYSVKNSNISIDATQISGNVEVLVKFHGQVFGATSTSRYWYDATEKSFSYTVYYPEIGTSDSDNDADSITVSYYIEEYDESAYEKTEAEIAALEYDLTSVKETDVGKYSVYVKVEVDYHEENVANTTHYFGPYTFEIIEGANSWILNMSCPSITVGEELVSIATSKWGDAIIYYWDPTDKETTMTSTTPTDADRYNAQAFVPASFPDESLLPYDFDKKDINSYDSYGYPIDSNGDRLTDEDGDIIEINYPAIFSDVVYFDIQDTATFTVPYKDIDQLDNKSSGVQILTESAYAPINGGFSLRTLFIYHKNDEETSDNKETLGLLFTESELPVGTKITMIDYCDNIPLVYYYVVTGEEAKIYKYDISMGDDGTANEWVENDDGTAVATAILYTDFHRMGTENDPWVDRIPSTEDAGTVAATDFQFIFEFPEMTDEEIYKEYTVDFTTREFEEEDGKIVVADYEFITNDADDSVTSYGYRNEELNVSLELQDPELTEGTIYVEADVENNVIISDVRVSDVFYDNTYLAVQLLDEYGVLLELPPEAVVTLTNSYGNTITAEATRGGFIVFKVTNGDYELSISNLQAAKYELKFALCENADNNEYPMANIEDSDDVDSDGNAQDTSVVNFEIDLEIETINYAIKAELAETEDDERYFDTSSGDETLSFEVTTTPADESYDVTFQSKNEDGEYSDIEGFTWDSDTKTVTIPKGTPSGTYRINFTIGDATFPFNIIVK